MADASAFYQQRALVEKSAALLGGAAADFSCAAGAGIGDPQRGAGSYLKNGSGFGAAALSAAEGVAVKIDINALAARDMQKAVERTGRDVRTEYHAAPAAYGADKLLPRCHDCCRADAKRRCGKDAPDHYQGQQHTHTLFQHLHILTP